MANELVAITGAARGVGHCVAQRLHAAGYRVLLLDRDPGVLNLGVELTGRDDVAYMVDIADEAALRHAIRLLIESHGVPDVWINNAGVGRWGPFNPHDLGAERDEMAVNYHGSVHAIRALLPHWQARGSGHLIQVTSAAALFYGPNMASYSASKAAIGAFVRALRVELRGSGIAISEVIPNTIATRMSAGANRRYIPRVAALRPELTPDEVAAAIQRAIRQRPREMRLPRLLTPFHLLLTVAPRLIDWLYSLGTVGDRGAIPTERPARNAKGGQKS